MIYYRYADYISYYEEGNPVVISLREFKIVRETEHTVWLATCSVSHADQVRDRYNELTETDPKYAKDYLRCSTVMCRKNADRSFAHSTKERAWGAFKRRKNAHMRHLREQFAKCEQSINYFTENPEVPTESYTFIGEHCLIKDIHYVEM